MLFETNSVLATVMHWELCIQAEAELNQWQVSILEMNTNIYKPSEPSGLLVWKQNQQSLGKFLQE